jgi:hypothetical protein
MGRAPAQNINRDPTQSEDHLMHINGIHHSGSSCVEIEYNEEAQEIFKQVYVAGECRRQEEVKEASVGSLTPAMKLRYETGWRVLSRLGREPSRRLRLTVDESTNGLVTMLAATLHSLDQNRPVASLQSALVLMAKIAPVPVCPVPVPPAVEIFDRSSTPEDVWRTFEFLRTCRPSERPQIFLMKLYDLWYELRQVTNPGPDLARLVQVLGKTTSLFRLTMQRLALLNVGSSDSGESREGTTV